jgi:hypothetical protein
MSSTSIVSDSFSKERTTADNSVFEFKSTRAGPTKFSRKQKVNKRAIRFLMAVMFLWIFVNIKNYKLVLYKLKSF